jgi:hypothetical protein
MLAVITTMSPLLTSCSDDDDDKSTSAVILESFGPSPAVRGGRLTFIGRNMDRVTNVIIPNGIEISDIEVVSREQIKVTIPQEAMPGYVKLIAPGIELTTKTLLAFKEPVSISSISPSPIKAGQKLTITGEYLNLMHKVIFSKEVEVASSEFLKWDRKTIELILPKAAQSGTITLADTASIPNELVSEMVLEVVLPSVDNIVELKDKKPGDNIKIAANDLDLIEKIELPNGDLADFSIEDESIVFNLPANSIDGMVKMIAFSGIKIPIADIEMALPGSLTATPSSELRGGDIITIAGTNLELVTSLSFIGVETDVTPASQSSTEITVIMPEMAKSGSITLHTASGKSSTIDITTQKPVVGSYSPNPVAAGSQLVINGSNLDLITSITFEGGKKVEVVATTPSQLTVTVPVDAESGALLLAMKNGETVLASSLNVEKPVFCYIPVLPDPSEKITAGEILVVEVKNEDKLTNVAINGKNTQYILKGTTLSILIPADVSGNAGLKLTSINGEVTYTIKVSAPGIVEKVIFTGPISLSWGDEGRFSLPLSEFEGLAAGSIMKIYLTQTENWGQAQINNGNWAQISFAELNNTGYLTTDILGDKSVTSFELILTADVLNEIITNASWGNAVIIQGSDMIIDKISIITK